MGRKSILYAEDGGVGQVEGFVVAGVGYDYVVGVDLWKSCCFNQELFQLVYIVLVSGRNR